MSLRRGLPAFALLAVACASPQTTDPPTIHYGQDLCAHCNMIVSEERFASAAIVQTPDGRYEPVIYDDIGCMVAAGNPAEGVVVARYVHDHDALGWIPAETATYVRSDELRSPMLSGLAAWAGREGAEGGARRFSGVVVEYAELPALSGPPETGEPPL